MQKDLTMEILKEAILSALDRIAAVSVLHFVVSNAFSRKVANGSSEVLQQKIAEEVNMSLNPEVQYFNSRKILQADTPKLCTQIKYDNCFSRCPPVIPGPPPTPASLENYRRTWCTGHNSPWQCSNTNYGPQINGTNPRLTVTKAPAKPARSASTVISLSVVIPCVAIIAVVAALLIARRNRRALNKKKADNTYNLGYLSKPQAPTWTDNDGTEVAVEDGSEIFYQVDRTAAFSANLNGGGNMRAMPDVIHSSSATIRKSPPTNMSVFDLGRSGSATSQAPLLSSPEIAHHHRRRNGNRMPSVGQDGESDLGSPTYSHYGATQHQPVTRKGSHELSSSDGVTSPGNTSGYMTYSPTTKSHPSLYYSGGEKFENTGTVVRTPKTRQRSFGSHDSSKPRPLRKPSGASNVQRSDSMTLNRAGGRENYKTNWDNFDEVTATMRKEKHGPSNRELVLGIDSFVDSFTTPEQEEATSVDQLGLPDRNPFLTGYYDYEPGNDADNIEDEFDDFSHRHSNYHNSVPESDRPPSYDEVNARNPGVSRSQMPTLDLRGSRRDRHSEYDSEASVEV
ncbi:hypothetical protein EB796_019293 [Bugula neritina]|uniref:Uncharacterized protein n=1 Tax=Bugula neritina TaxID=10212 RepID=A0A7J7J8T6_BUGNE|nr:hypothetical protein EB796_019293 [Bugula neritina]